MTIMSFLDAIIEFLDYYLDTTSRCHCKFKNRAIINLKNLKISCLRDCSSQIGEYFKNK